MTDAHSDDPVKKVFGKTAQEILATKQPHTDFHSAGAFCGSAGPEEMKHLQRLLDELTQAELAALVDAVGIRFGWPTNELNRYELENVIEEADREIFYKEYYRIVGARVGGAGDS